MRLARLKGRPVLVCGMGAGKVRDDYLKDHLDLARFTFLDVPTTKIFRIPEGKVFHAHTDLWMHRESIYREQARAWLQNILKRDQEDATRKQNHENIHENHSRPPGDMGNGDNPCHGDGKNAGADRESSVKLLV
jgi:hypothetical protein